MNMIVAADKKNGIGYQGKLLVTIPFDQQLFRKETIGKVVVMGRKTLGAFQADVCLKDAPTLC